MEDKYNKFSATSLDKTRKEILEKVYALAFEYEQRYGSCSQCVLAAIQDVFGIVDDEVFKSVHQANFIYQQNVYEIIRIEWKEIIAA